MSQTEWVNSKLLISSAAISLMSVMSAQAYDMAAATAAANGPACVDAAPFYWEIGGASGGPIVSGQVGDATYDRNTSVQLASASKWVFGAYVVEKHNGIPTGAAGATIVSALNMQQGHTAFNPFHCYFTAKVSSCHTVGSNEVVDAGKIGSFNYNGGDGQFAAADAGLLGLGNKYKFQLLAEVNAYLSLGSSFKYETPGVSGGMMANAADYAQFLQRLMDGSYEMSDYLNYSPVDTVCANCDSPFGTADMHYSLHHWIEDNTTGQNADGTPLAPGDGSYSSLGAFGFYPWITADKAYYGLISRDSVTGDSFSCGRAIRDAFLN